MAKPPTPYDDVARDSVLGVAYSIVQDARVRQRCYREGWADCVKALKAMDIEWGMADVDKGFSCPACDGYKTKGHEEDCPLAAILNSVEENDG